MQCRLSFFAIACARRGDSFADGGSDGDGDGGVGGRRSEKLRRNAPSKKTSHLQSALSLQSSFSVVVIVHI